MYVLDDMYVHSHYSLQVTHYKMALEMQSEVINGPAWDGDGSDNSQPPFSWRNWKDVAHHGMVHTYRTLFEVQSPHA
jgi:hypothetical protein